MHSDREQFTEAINLAVFKTGLEPEAIEKDYYVTMVLKKLSERFDFLVFKGGTSLQKCHRVISRFSEDIDITFDNLLSQGEKRKLKYGIVDITAELGMTIPNIDDIYNILTVKLLEDKVLYEEAIISVRRIADSGMFDE